MAVTEIATGTGTGDPHQHVARPPHRAIAAAVEAAHLAGSAVQHAPLPVRHTAAQTRDDRVLTLVATDLGVTARDHALSRPALELAANLTFIAWVLQ